jgi:hypothetical protein
MEPQDVTPDRRARLRAYETKSEED